MFAIKPAEDPGRGKELEQFDLFWCLTWLGLWHMEKKDIQISRVKRLDSTNSVVIRLEILNFDPPIQATFYWFERL